MEPGQSLRLKLSLETINNIIYTGKTHKNKFLVVRRLRDLRALCGQIDQLVSKFAERGTIVLIRGNAEEIAVQ